MIVLSHHRLGEGRETNHEGEVEVPVRGRADLGLRWPDHGGGYAPRITSLNIKYLHLISIFVIFFASI